MDGVNHGAVKKPGVISLLVAMAVSVALLSAAAASLHIGQLIFAWISFVAASASLACLRFFFRSPLVCAVPVAGCCLAYLSGASVFLGAAVACAATVIAAAYTICNIKKTDSFRQFLWCTFTYSLLYGFLFCLCLVVVYGGGVSDGILALGKRISSFSGYLISYIESVGLESAELAPYIEEALSTAVVYIPAFVVMAGVASAWIMRGVFSAFTRVMCRTSVFAGRQAATPRSLAITFLVLSIFGTFLSLLSTEIFFTANNITYILTLVFMGEGVKAFLAPYSKHAKTKGNITSLVGAIVLLFFIPQLVLLILPYYGAFKVISQSKKRRGAGGSK